MGFGIFGKSICLAPPLFKCLSLFSHSLDSQGTQCQVLDVAVSALAWLSSMVLVSGAEDGSLQGWVLKEHSLQSLWLLSRSQKPVLGLATSQELLASASGTTEQWAGLPNHSFKYANTCLQVTIIYMYV